MVFLDLKAIKDGNSVRFSIKKDDVIDYNIKAGKRYRIKVIGEICKTTISKINKDPSEKEKEI